MSRGDRSVGNGGGLGRRVVRDLIDTIGPAFGALTNMLFIPGVYLRMAVRGVAFRLAGVPIAFGPATTERSRGVFSNDEKASAPAGRALLWSGAILTVIGLVIIAPEILRQVVLDAPALTPSYDELSLMDFAINRWLHDWPRGLAAWVGASALIMAPLTSDEWAIVRRPSRAHHVAGAGLVFAVADAVTRALEPLDSLGRLSIGALWSVTTVWLMIRGIEFASGLML
jgi:hypothetical protein